MLFSQAAKGGRDRSVYQSDLQKAEAALKLEVKKMYEESVPEIRRQLIAEQIPDEEQKEFLKSFFLELQAEAIVNFNHKLNEKRLKNTVLK